MITALIWDFNGTVMDDLNASVCAVNAMLTRRGLPLITEEWYTKNLVMPLEVFYEGVGFDMKKENLPEVSEEFQKECQKYPRPVFPEVQEALERFFKKGMHQALFSSLYHDTLLAQVQERGIEGYFEGIEGQKNRLLGGKTATVKEYLHRRGIRPEEALIIGDLTTDGQMAKALGCPCALIAKGHQHFEVLKKTGAYVLKDASNLDALLEELK